MTDSKTKLEESYRQYVRSILNEEYKTPDWTTIDPEGFDCHSGEVIELNKFSDVDADAKHSTFVVLKDFNLRKVYKEFLLNDTNASIYGFVEYLVKQGLAKTNDRIFEIREDEEPYVFEV